MGCRRPPQVIELAYRLGPPHRRRPACPRCFPYSPLGGSKGCEVIYFCGLLRFTAIPIQKIGDKLVNANDAFNRRFEAIQSFGLQSSFSLTSLRRIEITPHRGERQHCCHLAYHRLACIREHVLMMRRAVTKMTLFAPCRGERQAATIVA